MKRKSIWSLLGFVALVLNINFSISHAANAADVSNLDGRWAATITEGQRVIPFRLDISSSGNHVTGKLYNGADDYETTTSAKIAARLATPTPSKPRPCRRAISGQP